MYKKIDYEKLRRDLIDYYGTASQIFRISIMELSKVERASNEQLIDIALSNRFNLSNYTSPYKKIR